MVRCIFIVEGRYNLIYPLETGQTSVPDIIQFLTGSDKFPATGFDRSFTINFTDRRCLPVASTCALSITFPRTWGLLQYPAFVEKMHEIVHNSWGFGTV